MLASPLPPSFLGTYSLSTSSLGCNALCMVISFLVFWSICLSSSLVYLRKSPEYLTSGTAQVFIPLIRFLSESFVSSSFLVLLRYSFRIWFFISSCSMVSASKNPKYVQVSFSASVPILSWFGSSIPSVRCRLLHFITSRAHFSTVCIRVSNSFSFFANSFMPSMYIRWLIFSCNILSLYPAVHFLSMWFSGIMAIMKRWGDSASP